ncbi:ShlB/FhaC/HecB family hemolysin secretion/activation protein [Sphingomonas gilva]|uniref:ShlB/FhaC/HecB family hemolysin secretion/activation protein n=1 Tax=Sphingomonas gilva TaxID=2305907 RepID=UPI001CA3CE89|nr:ShlB/FhaC/HecB family hemolysin secretion/activation protein [Sphingomonas gilva]
MASVFAAPASAQTPPPTQGIPSREEVTPPAPEETAAPNVSVDSREAVVRSTCPFEGSELTLNLSAVTYARPDGSPVQPEIAEALSGVDHATGAQPLKVVCDIRDAANAALARSGYIASVQIPPQNIDTGTLQLHVITARLTEVRVRGTPGPYADTLAARVEQLKSLDPLNEKDAERALLLAGDIPGLDVQLALRPAGTAPGDVIGDLNITYRPFAILANAQNYNSRQLGRETVYLRAEAYGLTGLSDVTYVGAQSTVDFEEQKIAQIGHIFGLNSSGTTLGGRFTYAWSRPDLDVLDLRTNTLIAGVDLRHPLVRSLTTNVALSGGFDYVDQDTRVFSGGSGTLLNLDKLRIGYLRLDGDYRTPPAQTGVSFSIEGGVELRKGFDIFDATPQGSFQASRIAGNSEAFVVRADADAVIGVGPIFSLAGSARAQWTDDPLLNYEEFSLGNLTIGRGYDPGANSGDRAVGVRGEVRANIPVGEDFGVQAFGFYDKVWLTNLDPGSTEVDRDFGSWGGGVRVTLPNRMLLEVTYAKPEDKALTIDAAPPTDRVLVSLTLQFRAGAR